MYFEEIFNYNATIWRRISQTDVNFDETMMDGTLMNWLSNLQAIAHHYLTITSIKLNRDAQTSSIIFVLFLNILLFLVLLASISLILAELIVTL